MKGASMKTRLLIVAAGLGVCLVSSMGWAQPKTREEVRGEAASAARSGDIDRGEITKVPPAQSTKARAEVKAETRSAVRARTIDHGEVTAAPPVTAPTKTRAEVKSEAASALQTRSIAKPDEPAAKKP